MKYTLRGTKPSIDFESNTTNWFLPSSQWKLDYSWLTSDNDRQKTHSLCFKAMGQHAQRVNLRKNLFKWEYTFTVRTMVSLRPVTHTPPSLSSYLLKNSKSNRPKQQSDYCCGFQFFFCLIIRQNCQIYYTRSITGRKLK